MENDFEILRQAIAVNENLKKGSTEKEIIDRLVSLNFAGNVINSILGKAKELALKEKILSGYTPKTTAYQLAPHASSVAQLKKQEPLPSGITAEQTLKTKTVIETAKPVNIPPVKKETEQLKPLHEKLIHIMGKPKKPIYEDLRKPVETHTIKPEQPTRTELNQQVKEVQAVREQQAKEMQEVKEQQAKEREEARKQQRALREEILFKEAEEVRKEEREKKAQEELKKVALQKEEEARKQAMLKEQEEKRKQELRKEAEVKRLQAEKELQEAKQEAMREEALKAARVEEMIEEGRSALRKAREDAQALPVEKEVPKEVKEGVPPRTPVRFHIVDPKVIEGTKKEETDVEENIEEPIPKIVIKPVAETAQVETIKKEDIPVNVKPIPELQKKDKPLPEEAHTQATPAKPSATISKPLEEKEEPTVSTHEIDEAVLLAQELRDAGASLNECIATLLQSGYGVSSTTEIMQHIV